MSGNNRSKAQTKINLPVSQDTLAKLGFLALVQGEPRAAVVATLVDKAARAEGYPTLPTNTKRDKSK